MENTNKKREIGGYFSLELSTGDEYHKDAVALSSARAALQYVLRAKKYKKIYLPHYICGCVLQPILAEGVDYEYYSINESFEPEFDKELSEDECFLYVNYFGLCQKNVKQIVQNYKNVIIDSTQAFYAPREKGADTIYSARKFFGVPDGGYLYTDTMLDETLETDISYQRMEHLLKRIDLSANEGYSSFQENECSLDNAGIKYMSNLTHALLSGIDYETVAERRRANYQYLDSLIGDSNAFVLPELGGQVPMIYPYLTEDKDLRSRLIQNKIYVATYWNDVLSHVSAESLESNYVNYLLPLPMDQRYGIEELTYIPKILSEEF